MRALAILTIAVAAVSGAAAAGLGAQDEKHVATGKQTFQTYCATCHGQSAVGDGVLAKSLRKRPPNLTQLSRLANGAFPADDVFKAIEGANRPASSDMPGWREMFLKMQDNPGPDGVKAKITALVDYLESIQDKP